MKRLFLLLITLPLLLCGCGEPNATQTIFAMDTVMAFQVWGKDAPQAVQGISHTISDLESCYNRAGLARGAADPAVLQEVLDLSRRTGGAFDPQLGSVTALWNFTAEDPKIPTAEQICDALQKKTWDLGVFYIPIMTVLVMFMTNSANLQDGVDGILSSVTVVGFGSAESKLFLNFFIRMRMSGVFSSWKL